jgi:hypothetical protein
MKYQYSAENHDWDLTLRAAWCLLMSGQAGEYIDIPGTVAEREFASYLGSMMLSFCAVESFSASVAFSMPKTYRFKKFDFQKCRQSSRFWDKVELLFDAIPHTIDKSGGLFQSIGDMQVWRNLLAHSSPYEIENIPISNTVDEQRKLHVPFRDKEYARQVALDDAKRFYSTAIEYINLLKTLTDIEPHASATFAPIDPRPQ